MRASMISLALFMSACCFGSTSEGAPRPGDQMTRVATEMQREFPDVERHFAGMSYDEGFVAGAALSQRGLPRLSDADLLAYASIRGRILASSDEACAAMVGGGDHRAAVAAFEELPEDELRAFMRVTTRAQSLELQGGPRPLSLEAASVVLADGVVQLREALSEDERARWDVAVMSTAPADACFVERTVLREAGRAPGGAGILRAMLESSQAP